MLDPQRLADYLSGLITAWPWGTVPTEFGDQPGPLCGQHWVPTEAYWVEKESVPAPGSVFGKPLTVYHSRCGPRGFPSPSFTVPLPVAEVLHLAPTFYRTLRCTCCRKAVPIERYYWSFDGSKVVGE